MDNNIKNLVLELSNAVNESKEYKEYCKYHKELLENPEIKKIVDDFRILQTEIELKRLSENSVSKEEEQRVDKLYDKVSENELCSNFIESEKKLITLVSEIYKMLGENISIDMDFFKSIN
ncbi:hypothetical protein B5E58_01660 [Tyzzerella sp. An114]|uniref:YlbF family regulator n=1 Tax=Tyzzerella sp. An114 TaxID=1965545 RepID=UPI000B42E96B|nr:YlbF family regulator [Tyzzerella sp. An114]OUQ60603.1 hypothetical protein B5E58_01660 [Tyzzerella sp. An114]